MRFPSTCFVGRIVIRRDQAGGLDWKRPCPVPAENTLDFDPPMYFCSPHFQVLTDHMHGALDAAGMIDRRIVAGPLDDFDALMEAQRRLDPGE